MLGALESSQVRYLVVGGLAVAAHGHLLDDASRREEIRQDEGDA